MDNKLLAALIAAGVSIVVSAIGFPSSWFALRAKRIELERQIRSGYMQKLYERRLDLYPKVFKITRGPSRPPLTLNVRQTNPPACESGDRSQLNAACEMNVQSEALRKMSIPTHPDIPKVMERYTACRSLK